MNKRFSELTVSATDFANDDVIAIDGETNGTRKMSGSALKSAMKSNTLATADGNAYIVSDGDVVRIKDWSKSITSFRTDDVIPVDGTDGTAKMSKDDLLRVTAENALAGNLALAFDPTRTNENQYKAGEHVIYEGKEYIFVAPHYGAWNTNDVKLKIDVDYAETDSDYIHKNLGVFENLLYMKTNSNWFSASYSKGWKVRINYAGTEGSIYFKWDYEHIRYNCMIDIILLTNNVTLRQISATPLGGTAYSIKDSRLIKAADNIVEIAVNFTSSSNLNTLGDLAIVVAGDRSLSSPLRDFNAIQKISDNELKIEELGAKNRPPLVESEGRVYDVLTLTNSSGMTQQRDNCKHYFGKVGTLARCDAWARFFVEGFMHKVGERCGIMLWIDPAYIKKDYQTDSVLNQKLADFSVQFYAADDTILETCNHVYYELNNGWNFIQSGVLNSVCAKIRITPYANLSTEHFWIAIDSIVCGRKTKPVICVTYDGAYKSTDDCGVYDWHYNNGIPCTIMCAQQVSDTLNSYMVKVLGLKAKGVAEVGIYGEAVQQSTFNLADASVKNTKNNLYNALLDGKIMSVGTAHNSACTKAYNLFVDNGIEFLRGITCKGQNVISPQMGLRQVDSKGYVVGSESWSEEDDATLVANAKAYIDSLIANGDWGSITMHQIVNRSDITSGDVNLATTKEAWEEIMTYLKAKSDAGDIKPMSLADLWRQGSYNR